MGVIARGLAAGAAGVTALNTAGYLDMALRARPASSAPADTVENLADRVGRELPGSRGERANRRTALGSLAGIGTGLLVGIGASVARAAGIRLPGVVAAAATGAVAMAASDVPMAALGITEPRRWSQPDWVADGVPHLAYGFAAHAVLNLDGSPDSAAATAQLPPSAGLVLRSALLGLATGARSSLGFAGPVLTAARGAGAGSAVTGRAGSTVAALSLAGELVADKLPQTPSRLDGPALPFRLVSGASGSAGLARRQHARVTLPLAAGLLGAWGGSFAGARWRASSARDRPDWQGALVEDGVALAVAALACLPGRHPKS